MESEDITMSNTNAGSADNAAAASRDYTAISPSAYALLMMKGETSIPFAREAAALLKRTAGEQLGGPPHFGSSPADYWTRVMHFENRYWSIDQLLEDQPFTNILELSSGFSFRGLALSRQRPVFYIDTDLEGVIAGKQRFVDALVTGATPPPPGHYELQALNVLDAAAFRAVVARFPPGPIAIVNEGLLVYLDAVEKETLCQHIRECLLARGGCWITADIYLQRPAGAPPTVESKSYRKWASQHQIEDKKFKSLADAEAFFRRMGFTVDREAQPNYARLTSLTRLREEGGPAAIEHLRRHRGPRLHTTWRLLAS
jgi:O-methyltransferase involved in polyketide biosynthesis